MNRFGETIEAYDENVKSMIDDDKREADGREFEEAGFSGTDENDELDIIIRRRISG